MVKRYSAWVLAALVLLLGPATALAQEHEEEGHEAEEILDPIHHSSDGFYLDFEPFGKVELPRIFLVRRAEGGMGFDVYASTIGALNSGEYEIYVDEHADDGHSSHLDAKLVPAAGRGEILVDLSFTRHLIFAWLSAGLLLLIFGSLGRRYKRGIGRDTAPKGLFQNMFETLVLFVRDEIARPNLGDKADKYLPFLLTSFFFILFCNFLGLVPFGATATSNIMLTGVLATVTFVLTQLGGTKDYWMHILWPPGVPGFVKPILIPVEILGLFTKPFALAIRLFANMTAGHLIILSLIGLIFTFNSLFGQIAGIGVVPLSIAFSLFIYLLEILVSFLQAYIFVMLSALFIGMAVAEHEHHAEHEEHHAPAALSAETARPVVVSQEGVAAAEPEPVLAG